MDFHLYLMTVHNRIGYLLSIKQDIFKIFSFINGDKNDFLSPLVLSN